jgi:hypothetical protein
MSEQDIIDDIKRHDWKESWLDFSILLYERNQLVIVGSDDLSYYYTLEIIIKSPSYISGVIDWSCDLDEGFVKLSAYSDDPRKILVLEFHADDELKFKVVAEEISVNFDVIYYYNKENLNVGERLAYWVK